MVKWNNFRERQSENGKKGGRPKKDLDNLDNNINPKNPTLLNESQKSLTVNDNVNVSGSVNNITTTPILGIDYVKSYSVLPDDFKEIYDEIFYKSWLNINKHISENCKYLRMWTDQITIKEFKSIYDRIDKKEITINQVRQALTDLDGSKIAKEKYNSVFHGFNTYLKTILKNV